MKEPTPSTRTATRVVHVITSLQVGGAETMLVRLLSALDPSVENSVICLSSMGPLAERLRAFGVHVEALGLRSGPSALLGLPKLIHLLRRARPQVVHTWMYHADLMGGLAARLLGIPAIWALHGSTLDPTPAGRSTALVVHALARLSSTVPTRIVSCSEVGRKVHEQLGYDSRRMLVIQNGFDTEQFRPNPDARREARALWGAGETDRVVGHAARFHPQKDHRNLLRAAGLATRLEPRLRFVLYGPGITPDNTELVAWAREAGVLERCSFLGLEPNMPRRLPGFDLLVSSSSFGEAFPLILGEAMASGVPCVTTDVGDSAVIVADARRVVPPGDASALAAAIVRAVQLDASAQALEIARGIAHIQDDFALVRVARRYRDLYREVAQSA